MTTPIKIELKCPCCNTKFESRSLMSTTVGFKETDFHPISLGFQALPLYIHTCTHCGFTGLLGDFEKPKKISNQLAKRISNEIGPLVRDGLPDGGTRYEFAARIAEWQGKDPETIANLYLHAAWCCVDERDMENESIYRLSAIEYFKRALDEEGCLSDDSRTTVTYLIGELYRRVGEIELAHEWFNRVISESDSDEAKQKIVALAKQQKDNPKNML
ncbi:DUF2225 domain-containing protein [Candidatus Poribacteria bacterium]|nr:DUF2225 domain-containing protein [Candidatus Poribacteria bacterium]